MDPYRIIRSEAELEAVATDSLVCPAYYLGAIYEKAAPNEWVEPGCEDSIPTAALWEVMTGSYDGLVMDEDREAWVLIDAAAPKLVRPPPPREVTETTPPAFSCAPQGSWPMTHHTLEEAQQAIPVSLRFVNYDDRLTKEQMSMILAGQWNHAENDIDENFSDSAYEEAITTARNEINEAVEEGRFDREWDDLDPDEQDEARHAVEERDDSDPVKDLLRNTPDQLLRTSLGKPAERLSEPRWASGQRLDDGGFAARHDAVAALLKDSGMDVDASGVREAIEELINEGPHDWHEGVQVDVIWYGGLEDAVPTPRGESPETEGQKVLEFATPHILLINKWNGSGHEVVVPAPLKRTLTRVGYDDEAAPQTGRAYLDSDTGGYGWDSVAGVYMPAYKDGAPSATWQA